MKTKSLLRVAAVQNQRFLLPVGNRKCYHLCPLICGCTCGTVGERQGGVGEVEKEQKKGGEDTKLSFYWRKKRRVSDVEEEGREDVL